MKAGHRPLVAALILALVPLAPAGAQLALPDSLDTPDVPPAPSASPASATAGMAFPAPQGVWFEQNLGQFAEPALFKVRAADQEGFLTPHGVVSILSGADGSQGVAIEMLFVDADPQVMAVPAGRLPGVSNYLRGDDPTKWVTSVPHYAQVTLLDVYPGIDVTFHGDGEGRLKYDIIVRPGADARRIQIAFDGIDASRLDEDGNLLLETAVGTLRHDAPWTFQPLDEAADALDAAAHVTVDSAYVLEQDGTVRFRVGDYDRSLPLVIDPLVYSTFIGANGWEQAHAVAVDAARNTYVAGITEDTDFPTTTGAYDRTHNGDFDVFVTKMNAAGTALIFSTYIGGTAEDQVDDMALDAAGNVFLAGVTYSSNYPTTIGAVDRTYGGVSDAFVTALGPTGGSLVFSTFLGGSNYDLATGVAIDAGGNVYAVGFTQSLNFPVTAGVHQTTRSGILDSFVTKLTPSGNAYSYSTYLGGSDRDFLSDVAVDASGNAIVTGETFSTDYATTAGAYRTTFAGGDSDAIVSKLNPTGAALVFSTFLGGSGEDRSNALALDTTGNVHLGGWTESTNFPVTSGVFQPTNAGGCSGSTLDGFVTKLNSFGSALQYSSYLGGDCGDRIADVAVDGAGNAYLTGHTASGDFPTTPGAFQTTRPGTAGWEVFVTKVNPSASALSYSTFIGSTGEEEGFGIAVDGAANAYVVGKSSSSGSGFPVTPGAYDTIHGFSWDAFSLKLAFTVPGVPQGFSAACAQRGVALSWSPPNESAVAEYRVYYGTTNPPTTVEVLPATATGWTHQPAWSTTTYFYQVSAANSLGEGAKTSVQSRAPCDLVLPTVSGAPQSYPWGPTIPSLSGATWSDDYSGLDDDVTYKIGTTSGGSNVQGSTAMPIQPAQGQTTGYTPTWTPTTAAQGVNYVNVVVHDVAGNVRTSNGAYVFRYDTLAPTSSGDPVVTTWRNTNPSLSGVCFRDLHSGLDNNAQYWIGSTAGGSDHLAATSMPTQPTAGQTTDWCPTFSVFAAALAQGVNYVTVQVRDTLGHSNAVHAYEIRYDSAAPVVSGLVARTGVGGSTIPENTWQPDNTPRFEWSVPTSTSPIVGYSYTLSTSSLTSPDTLVDTTSTFVDRSGSPLGNGNWYFKVRAKDEAGNWGAPTSFVLWVDAQAPNVVGLSSSSHPDPALHYSATTAAFQWSATSGPGGVAGFSHAIGSGSVPPAVDNTVDTTGTTASHSGLGPFGTWTVGVKALSNAGVWGAVSSRSVNIDNVAPAVSLLVPGQGDTSSSPIQTVRVDYHDRDGGADPLQATQVDVTQVQLIIDGVDVVAQWRDDPACQPVLGVLTVPGVCPIEVTADHVQYTPLVPWAPGVHGAMVVLKDTVVGANVHTTSWTFAIDPV